MVINAANPFSSTTGAFVFQGGNLQAGINLTGSNAFVTPLELVGPTAAATGAAVISGSNSIEFAGNATQGYSLQNNTGSHLHHQ